jgi:hypothetical protein
MSFLVTVSTSLLSLLISYTRTQLWDYLPQIPCNSCTAGCSQCFWIQWYSQSHISIKVPSSIYRISIDIPFGFLPWPQVSTPSTTKRKKVVICSFSLANFQPEKFNFDIHTQISMKRNWSYFEKRKKKSPLFSIPTTICEKGKNENETFKHMSSDFIFSHGNFLQIFYLKKIWFMT